MSSDPQQEVIALGYATPATAWNGYSPVRALAPAWIEILALLLNFLLWRGIIFDLVGGYAMLAVFFVAFLLAPIGFILTVAGTKPPWATWVGGVLAFLDALSSVALVFVALRNLPNC